LTPARVTLLTGLYEGIACLRPPPVSHAPMYYFSVPVLRTAIWFVGLLATLYLVFHVIAVALT